jgi:hypothetical protein
VFEGNVVQFQLELEHVSRNSGMYDDLYETMLTGVIEDTDDESAAGWSSYPPSRERRCSWCLAQAGRWKYGQRSSGGRR